MQRADFNDLPAVSEWIGNPLLRIGLVLWAITSIGGFLCLLLYSTTPGQLSTDVHSWPSKSRIVPDASRANLVLLVHPHCPCSRASVAELSEILTRCKGLVAAHVLFLKPSDKSAGWEVTELWHQAASIPGVQVLTDEAGREAQRFGAATSGDAALFNSDGRILFRGGITVARGHAGDNDGRHAIIGLLSGEIDGPLERIVFGCPLFSSDFSAASRNVAIGLPRHEPNASHGRDHQRTATLAKQSTHHAESDSPER